MSKLLINENPLLVLPTLAEKIGLNEAIFLQQLHYWMNQKNVGLEKNGVRWVYNTFDNWKSENFKFWSVDTIKRTIKNLINLGLVKTAQLSENKFDKTNYYTLDYSVLEKIEIGCDNSNLHQSKDVESATSDKCKMHQSGDAVCTNDYIRTETTTETTTDSIIANANKPKKITTSKLSIDEVKDLYPEVDELWNLSDVKTGKLSAYQAYAKARKTVSHETIISKFNEWKKSKRYKESVKKDGTKFIKMTATWLNQQCYFDDYSSDSKGIKEQQDIVGYDLASAIFGRNKEDDDKTIDA